MQHTYKNDEKKKKRRYRYVVTGKFKREISYNDLYTGQIIKPMKVNKGTDLLMSSVRWMMKSMSPAMREAKDKDGNKIVLSPVAATAQKMAIRGLDEPSAINEDGDVVEEDLTKLGQEVKFITKKGLPLKPERRKKLMSNEHEREKYSYDTESTYTFEFYQHLFDPLTFHMNVVGMTTFDVVSVLGRQPVRIMAKLWGSEEYLWDVEMWHSRIFNEGSETQ